MAELAEKLWRDLAAVPASCICEPTHTTLSQPGPASTQLAVRVIQCVCDKQKPSTRQTNGKERMLKTMENEPKFILRRVLAVYFFWQVLFVK